MAGTSTDRRLVFISYSHKDRAYLVQVRIYLRPWIRDGLLSVWEDTQIKASAHWREEITTALAWY